MTAMRPAPLTSAEAEMSASHAVLELARTNSVLSLLVFQLREAGKPWREVKAEIEAEFPVARQIHNGNAILWLYTACRFEAGPVRLPLLRSGPQTRSVSSDLAPLHAHPGIDSSRPLGLDHRLLALRVTLPETIRATWPLTIFTRSREPR